MKNFLIALATTASVVAASMALAAGTVNNSGYYLSTDATSKTLAVPATNITVLNYSEEKIFVVVPNSPINYEVISGNSRTISHDTLYADTHLVLQDWNRGTFFDANVCRRAIVTVDGRPGSYHVNVDRKFC